eukprot:CAMPEP_0202884074 /NCGR_PEP_ID=MMETSP1391-20130828/40397_1 /ASSEMBLY_ACC=CAM_ASM_000867 /TAXON_ID=1034604 /ORGANISM="Chlamydomonas leiostraca, Strain SAG 11-49" /LENGTH=52 /DNA_ID=CAMNT_0049567195 /DNA_START=15 /DNA_END=169 /DNA_ORIENTATION=+
MTAAMHASIAAGKAMQNAKPQGWSNMLLGLAKSKCHDGPLIAVCAERLASQG